MASLTDVIKQKRSSGQSRTGSLLGSLKDKFKEKIDPRKFLNQTGVLTALFPSLKAYKAGGDNDSSKNIQSKSAELINSSVSMSNDTLNDIATNTQIMAKNSLILPVLARDMNLLRQNMSKVVKLFGVQPTNKADSFFKKSKERESEYESKFSKTKTKSVFLNEMQPEKKGLLSSILGFLGKIITPILTILSTMLTGLISSLKSVIGLIVRPLMSIVASALTSVVKVMTLFAGKIFKSVLNIFKTVRLGSILSAFFATPIGKAAIIAAVIALGIFQLAEKYRENVEASKEALMLDAKVKMGEATEQDKERLQQLLQANPGLAAVIDPDKAMTNKAASPVKQYVDPETSKKVLDMLNSDEPGEVKEGEYLLKDLGVSKEALQEYYDKMYGPQATSKTRKEAGTLQEVEQRVQSRKPFPEEQQSLGAESNTQPEQKTETLEVSGHEKVTTLDLTQSQQGQNVPSVLDGTNKSLQGQLMEKMIRDIKEQQSVSGPGSLQNLFSSDSSTDVQSQNFNSSRMSDVADNEIRKYFTGLFGAIN